MIFTLGPVSFQINLSKNLVNKHNIYNNSIEENLYNDKNKILLNIGGGNFKHDKWKILDFYSGVGSFGLECLSRGAEKVTFVERDRKALEVLKKNISGLSIPDNSVTLVDSIKKVIDGNKKEKINIFFLDPPFADKNYLNNLQLISKNKIFKDDHIIIIHRERNSDDNLNTILNVLISKNYGRSKIIFGKLLK